MQCIVTNKNIKVYVDDDDFERVSKFKWRHDLQGYVVRSRKTNETHIKTKNVYLHREVMGFPSLEVDHRDQNKLNNQKSNLRCCTRRQNASNQKKRKGSYYSQHKGVTWNAQNKMWLARVHLGDGKVWGKCFSDEVIAAREYNKKALEVYGEFAVINEGV